MRRPAVVVLIAIVAAVVDAAPAYAQSLDRLPVGARVRVWAPGAAEADRAARHGATLAHAAADTLELGLAGGQVVRVSRAQLVRIDVSEGRRTASQGARHGARWGAVGGAIAGLMVGASMGGGSSGPGSCSDCSLVFGAGGAAGGALVGALAGAVVGHAHPGERWRTVALARKA